MALTMRDILRYTIITGVVFVPAVVPFIVSTSMFFPYITGKNFTFRIVVEILLALYVVLAVLDARYRPRFSWIAGAFIAFLVAIGVADLQGVYPFKSFWSNFERMEGYVTLLHLFGYFVVAGAVLVKEKTWDTLWHFSLGASTLMAFVALKPSFAAFPQFWMVPRLDATFGNPIYLAIYCVLHIFLVFILLSRRVRIPLWLAGISVAYVLLQLSVLALTLTRSAAVGLVGGGIIATVLIAFFERERPMVRKGAIGALAVLALMAGTIYAIKDTDFGRTTPVVNRFTDMTVEGTVAARLDNWGMAWQGVKERPLLGYGQDNYEYVFARHFNPDMYNDEPWFDRTHNILFDWLIAGGFVGAIAYFLILVATIAHLWLLNPRTKWYSFSRLRDILRGNHMGEMTVTERALWTGFFAAYTFHNIFVFDNITSYVFYVLVLAYLHARITSGNDPLWSGRRIPEQVATSVVLPVALVVCVALIYLVNWPGIATTQSLLSALIDRGAPAQNLEYFKRALAYDQLGRIEVREQLVQVAVNVVRNPEIPNDVREAYRAAATEGLEQELGRNPLSPRLQLFAGTFYLSMGGSDTALDRMLKARELSPRKQLTLFQLGDVYFSRGENDKALDVFKTAYELQTDYDDARKYYAIALIRNGKDREAVDLLSERWQTAGIDDDRLLREWTNAKRYDIAAAVLAAKLEKDPKNAQLAVSLSATLAASGDKEQAIAVLVELKKDQPQYAEQVDTFIKDIRAGKQLGVGVN